jgi:uncharacterized membrane protein
MTVTLTNVALIVSSVSVGLFAGLMLTLVVILHQMWLKMTPSSYIESMQSFLPAAKGHPIITALTLLPIGTPILALIELGNPSDGRFVLSLIGLLLASAILFVTLRLNFPIYDTMMGWQPRQPAADYERVRRRFFHLNLTRMLLSSGALLCFLLALVG